MIKISWNKEDNIRDAGCWLSQKIKLIELKDVQEQKGEKREIKRGGIFYVELGEGNLGYEKNKCRPCLVISNNSVNEGETVIVIPLSTTIKSITKNGKLIPKYRTDFILEKSKYPFLKEDSCLKLQDIRCIDKLRIKEFLGNIDVKDLDLLKSKLNFTMGFK